jgi:purine-binding chemotaxis protein CheW
MDQSNIDYIEKENDPVVAIYKHEGMLIQVLSLRVLFERMHKVAIPAKEVLTGKIKNEITKEEESNRFLVFSMSEEKYALDIDYLQEIILADVEYTDIAGSSDELLGLITLRDELLMVVDLRVHYGFQAKNSDENRILIISYDGKKIGFCIDSIIDIKSIFIKNIEPMGESFNDNKIAGVIHDENSLISYFDHNVISNIFKENAAYVDDHSLGETQEKSETQEYFMEVIVFKLAGKEYAFNVERVDEIIDVVSSTNVAFTDKSIDGIINIRGQIVTTVSLFSKLGIPAVVNEDSKIIICNISGNRIGFVVDSVSDILNVKEEEIKEEDDEYFESVLYLENGSRLVLAMNIEKIIKKEQDNG